MIEKDYLDIYDTMRRLREEGLIRYGGLSNFRLHHLKTFPDEAFKVLVTNQVPYSLCGDSTRWKEPPTIFEPGVCASWLIARWLRGF